MRRIIIAGTASGSGKTTITCALLKALINRGYQVSAFKCGPDYIDPMFHSRIIGANARNLDNCFCDLDTIHYLLTQNAGEISVIEGVMGFYDGVGGTNGSSFQLAADIRTPAVLVIDCKGMSMSIGAVMQGFLTFNMPNRIAGFIFNRLPQSQVPLVQKLCKQLGTEYFGRFPSAPECALPSRHLGLVTDLEISGLKEKTEKLAALAQEHIDIDKLLAVSKCCGKVSAKNPLDRYQWSVGQQPKIAVAMDEVFCFHYEDNLDLLRTLGCELVMFSPLRDHTLPEQIDGLILSGGYPELYAGSLSDNQSMLHSIRRAVKGRVPTIAECGGFMYLHRQMEDDNGQFHQMAGVIKGNAVKTPKLQRFGYVDLTSKKDTLLAAKGETLAAHEFHYWDSTTPGTDYTAIKRSNQLTYDAVVADDDIYAGFPHLYFYANPKVAIRFVDRCREYANRRL